MNYLQFALTVFTGFFAIMNPIANTPIFLGMVGDKDDAEKKKIAKTATVTAFFIVLLFIVLGKYIFEVFSITIPAFKITGGLLILYVGFEMLMSKQSKIHSNRNEVDDSSMAISPLAIPMLAGPGTIVTAMNFSSNNNIVHVVIVIAMFLIIDLITYWAFRGSEKIVKKLGENLIAVIGKLMGLIIAIIGTGMIVEGIKLAFNLK